MQTCFRDSGTSATLETGSRPPRAGRQQLEVCSKNSSWSLRVLTALAKQPQLSSMIAEPDVTLTDYGLAIEDHIGISDVFFSSAVGSTFIDGGKFGHLPLAADETTAVGKRLRHGASIASESVVFQLTVVRTTVVTTFERHSGSSRYQQYLDSHLAQQCSGGTLSLETAACHHKAHTLLFHSVSAIPPDCE